MQEEFIVTIAMIAVFGGAAAIAVAYNFLKHLQNKKLESDFNSGMEALNYKYLARPVYQADCNVFMYMNRGGCRDIQFVIGQKKDSDDPEKYLTIYFSSALAICIPIKCLTAHNRYESTSEGHSFSIPFKIFPSTVIQNFILDHTTVGSIGISCNRSTRRITFIYHTPDGEDNIISGPIEYHGSIVSNLGTILGVSETWDGMTIQRVGDPNFTDEAVLRLYVYLGLTMNDIYYRTNITNFTKEQYPYTAKWYLDTVTNAASEGVRYV